MSAVFHVIDREKWERSAHFDYYYMQVKARYNISADVDITALLDFRGAHGLKFFPVMLYAIMRAVNRNREFRMGFDEEGRLGYWDEVVPSYTLFHPEDNTFTDVWSEYDSGFGTFYRTVTGDMERYGQIRGVIKARPGQPRNFCPVSCLPWLSFTSFSQDTYTDGPFLFPLIRFGRYFRRDGRMWLPLSVFVSHAAADGYHTCRLINDIQEIAARPELWPEGPEKEAPVGGREER